jgi:hypothetical protein
LHVGDHIGILCKFTADLNFTGVPVQNVVHFNKRIKTVDATTTKKVTHRDDASTAEIRQGYGGSAIIMPFYRAHMQIL